MKNKTWRYLCLLIVICLLPLSGCRRADAEETTPPVEEESPLSEEADTEDPTDADGENTGETVAEEDAAAQVPEKTQPEGTKPFWQSETTRQVNNLMAIASAGQTDYKVNGAKRGWMSKNGKLYGYYDGKYITTDTLVADGYLEKGLASADYEILLINGSDLAEMEGASVPKDSMDFGVFAATKQSGKYLIASSTGRAGQISEEGYQKLLARYNQDHGKAGKLSSASADYERILSYISLFEGRFEDYYVREVRKDSKYAMVVLSSRKDVTDIKQYILKNDNSFWEVVVPNAQTEYYPITAINRYLPDFNVELLPNYVLASWRGSILAEQGGAEAALFSSRFISSSSEISYLCATANCAYVVLESGNRYVCYKGNGIWKAVEVNSDREAENILREKTGAEYGFLILDD